MMKLSLVAIVLSVTATTVITSTVSSALQGGGGHQPTPDIMECGGDAESGETGSVCGSLPGYGATCSEAIDDAMQRAIQKSFACAICVPFASLRCLQNADVEHDSSTYADCTSCPAGSVGYPGMCATVNISCLTPSDYTTWCEPCPHW